MNEKLINAHAVEFLVMHFVKGVDVTDRNYKYFNLSSLFYSCNLLILYCIHWKTFYAGSISNRFYFWLSLNSPFASIWIRDGFSIWIWIEVSVSILNWSSITSWTISVKLIYNECIMSHVITTLSVILIDNTFNGDQLNENGSVSSYVNFNLISGWIVCE